jgi:dihydrofolate reductase
MISIIVAKAANGVIGKKGEIPWYLPDDLKHFVKITKGHTVIMGRKTYESIVKRLGHALSDRKNIIITSQNDYSAPGCEIVKNIDEIIQKFSNSSEEVFIIGGGEIYKRFLPIAKKLYVTNVRVELPGDTLFPATSEADWQLISSEPHKKDVKNSYDYTFLEYAKK